MHRPGAAERDEREVPRLDPLLDRDRADRLRHLGVDHVADPLGHDFRLEVQFVGESRYGVVRGVDVERHPAARERVGLDAAEHEVGVGDGRLGAAAPVTGRTRIGAGALWADAKPARLGIGDRAASGADRVDVDDRHQQREPLERSLGGDVGLAVDDQRDVEAGAAHVDADQVLASEQARQRDTAERPADRPGEERLQRGLPSGLRGDDAAA